MKAYLKRPLFILLTVCVLLAAFPTAANAAFRYGDANRDGRVDLADCLAVMDRYVGRPVDIDLRAADVTGDGKTDLTDVLRILDWYVGKDVDLDPSAGRGQEKTGQAVRAIECLPEDLEPYRILSVDGTRTAIVAARYFPSEEADEMPVEEDHLLIADLERDELISDRILPRNRYVYCVLPDGSVVTIDYETEQETVRVYDGGMTLLSTFESGGTIVSADRENGCLYVFDEDRDALVRTDLAGHTESVFDVTPGMSVVSYDPARRLAALTDLSAVAGYETDLLLVDTDTGEVCMEQPVDLLELEFGDAYLSYRGRIPAGTEYGEIVYRNALYTYSPAERTMLTALSLEENEYIEPDGDAPYLFSTRDRFDEASMTYEQSEYSLIDVRHGTRTAAIAELEDLIFPSGVYLPELGEFAVSGGAVSDEENAPRMFMVDPEELSFDIDVPAAPEFEPRPERELSPEFGAQREKAEAIERDFGVDVVFCDPALDHEDGSGYEFVSLESPSYPEETVAPAEEADMMLETLRRGLEDYPEGFFDEFRNARGQGGIRIMLVRELVNPIGDFIAGGVAYRIGAWYNIAIAIGNMWDVDTVHHELWHAVESKIYTKNDLAFNTSAWETLQPEGFEYSADLDRYENRYDMLEKYLIPYDNGRPYGDVYFARIYSTVNENEDRATLMEALLSEYYDAQTYGFEDPRDWFAQMPHLNAKLSFMAEETERVFGYVYWDRILDGRMSGEVYG